MWGGGGVVANREPGSYISTFFILSICLDLPNLPFCAVCQGWFIAKVDFKQVFNHVMRGQSIVIWDGVDGYYLASEETALLDRAWCGQKCGLEGP